MEKQARESCTGEHRYFVCEVIGVESEGKVFLLALCTACGDAFCKEFIVASPTQAIRLMKEEKQTKEK